MDDTVVILTRARIEQLKAGDVPTLQEARPYFQYLKWERRTAVAKRRMAKMIAEGKNPRRPRVDVEDVIHRDNVTSIKRRTS